MDQIEKNSNDLTDFLNGKSITNFNMVLDDIHSVITLHINNTHIVKINFSKVQDFTINEIGK